MIFSILNNIFCTGLLNELSLQSTTEQTRQERCHFVQELVIASTRQQCDNGEVPLQLKSMLKLLDSSPKDLLQEETEEDDKVLQNTTRQGNVVLRGRARSDAQNAKRRAEANRVSLDMNQKSDEIQNNSSKT